MAAPVTSKVVLTVASFKVAVPVVSKVAVLISAVFVMLPVFVKPVVVVAPSTFKVPVISVLVATVRSAPVTSKPFPASRAQSVLRSQDERYAHYK